MNSMIGKNRKDSTYRVVILRPDFQQEKSRVKLNTGLLIQKVSCHPSNSQFF